MTQRRGLPLAVLLLSMALVMPSFAASAEAHERRGACPKGSHAKKFKRQGKKHRHCVRKRRAPAPAAAPDKAATPIGDVITINTNTFRFCARPEGQEDMPCLPNELSYFAEERDLGGTPSSPLWKTTGTNVIRARPGDALRFKWGDLFCLVGGPFNNCFAHQPTTFPGMEQVATVNSWRPVDTWQIPADAAHIADEDGQIAFFCSVGRHASLGMTFVIDIDGGPATGGR